MIHSVKGLGKVQKNANRIFICIYCFGYEILDIDQGHIY